MRAVFSGSPRCRVKPVVKPLPGLKSGPPGLHIAMNGSIRDPAKVKKNVSANRFEEI